MEIQKCEKIKGSRFSGRLLTNGQCALLTKGSYNNLNMEIEYMVINAPFLLKQLFMRPSVAITQILSFSQMAASNGNT